MPGLAEQRLIICELEQTTAAHRIRLREACRTIHPPVDLVDKAKRHAGAVLIAADLAPAVTAVTKALFKGQSRSQQRRRLTAVFLETPRLLRTLRRFSR